MNTVNKTALSFPPAIGQNTLIGIFGQGWFEIISPLLLFNLENKSSVLKNGVHFMERMFSSSVELYRRFFS